MPSLIEITNTPFKDRYPKDWPPYEYFVHETQITPEIVQELKSLVEKKSSETEIDKFITKNPVILTSVLDFNNTGHHGAWVIPKKTIRQNISGEIPGLIPDFIVGGRNSSGTTWYVVELKGANHSLFTTSSNKLCLSSVANKGLCQILEYMHFCNKSQSYLREVLKLSEFVSAKGFLFIGESSETEDERKKDLKSSLNNMNKDLQIRSYNALFMHCDRILNSIEVMKGNHA
ncbi:MAG: DUF4263 domain-containing protein [Gammaproteobacteria bacterium]|nr:DUF4263 domain-containing protein [Gammaproteobacteria bacterium]